MARRTQPFALFRTGQRLAASIVTLAYWRWRQQWLLLVVTGIGMIAAVMVVCVVPLLSEVTLTAGVRDILNASPDKAEIALRATTFGLSTSGVNGVFQAVNPPFRQNLHTYLQGSPRFELQTPNFPLQVPGHFVSFPTQLDAISIADARSHVLLRQGRLPQTKSKRLEVVITPDTAAYWHIGVGAVLTIRCPLYTAPPSGSFGYIPQTLTLYVVGLFNVQPDDPFWHAETFENTHTDRNLELPHFTVLASDQTLLATFDAIATKNTLSEVYFATGSYAYMNWYYYLNPNTVSINQLDDLTNRLAATQAYIVTNFGSSQPLSSSDIETAEIFGPVLGSDISPSTLTTFRSRVSVAQIPIAIIEIQIMALILYFVSIMAGLLVDTQAEAIAVLRSRGGSDWQIVGALITQGISLSLLALIAGPLLAIGAVTLVVKRLLSPLDASTLSVITTTPVQSFFTVFWFALGAVIVAMIALSFSLARAARSNILTLRRETARSTRGPLWQRLNLDMIAAIIALTGYAVAVYLSNVPGLLNLQTQELVSGPLALIAPIFLLLAAVLLSLRLFPLLLRLGSRFVIHGRSAAPMLAVAQMARAPRQSVRMTLLLALATAFAIFTLVFAASQDVRAQDFATYSAAADFSGTIPSTATHLPISNEIALYRSIPGINSATVAYEGDIRSVAVRADLPLQIIAIDPATFVQATIWNDSDSPQHLTPLMTQLAAQRTTALRNSYIPAIVDSYTLNSLGLHVGDPFTVHQSDAIEGDDLRFLAIGTVQHVPTVNNTQFGSSVDNAALTGGVIVDYSSYAALELKRYDVLTLVNHVWLRSQETPAALAHVRAALQTPTFHLDTLYDRRAIKNALSSDPLYLNLISILALGTVTALLLALLGDLLASWQSVRSRLTHFAVLRTQGASPHQVASVLTWEQGIVYTTALLLGCAFGALLSITVVPALIFTNVPANGILSDLSSGEFFAIQHALPAQIVVPLSLGVAFVVLISICVIVLFMMTQIALRPSMSQMLRLNED